MGSLRKVTDLVYVILRDNKDARDSDDVLYCKVLEHYGQKLGVDFNRVSTISFFRNARRYRIPSIETVGRCRRKMQEEYITLRGSDRAERKRRDREKEFVDYARRV